MKHLTRTGAVLLALTLSLTACSGGVRQTDMEVVQRAADRRVSLVGEDTDTVDPQCTPGHYTIALNVFDRLVEVQRGGDGTSELVPSLAKYWSVTDGGLTYLFHLHEGVKFSNGALLTASDVLYTLVRLLTHPQSASRDLAAGIRGAADLQAGRADTLEGFQVLDDYDFTITLEQPSAAFLACLSTPGASILDEETTREAGDRFGRDPAWTVGTGPFVFKSWTPGVRMLLDANPGCWSGPPRSDGLQILLISDPEAQRLLFERGELDILDLDNLGSEAEYFIRGDIYQDLLRHGSRVGITYISLNQSVPPLDDLRVRRALQYALDRQLLLDAVCSGRGQVENGIFPQGLIGYNPNLPPIPFDLAAARDLLAEAGLADGFELEITLPSDSEQSITDLVSLSAAMWTRIGVRSRIVVLDEEAFLAKRRSGSLACSFSTWSADYNDPDNFIYTFFGTRENTDGRSLCYPDEMVMRRVREARGIADQTERMEVYQALERIIVQEDAAWIPLFSKQHYFVVSRRTDGFRVSWNGWSSSSYRDVAIR